MVPNRYEDTEAFCMLYPEDWDTTKEGPLVDISGYRGTGLLILTATEDTSIATSKKLDITVHNVSADSVAPATTNQVAAFTQIVGSNNTGAITKSEVIEVEIEGLDYQYLQLNLTETSTWEGFLSVVLVLPSMGYDPSPQNLND